jgi:serine/threonine-protein kinase
VTDRWARLESLCHAALARPAPERAAFLAAACGGDEALRHEVASLVAQAESGSHFLETPVGGVEDNAALVGRRLGAYRLDAYLGAGGMGAVYRAHDPRLGRDVAVKVLPPAWAGDAGRRARFEREARAVAALKHPNICTIHDVGHADGVDFLVMELIDGESLAARLGRGPLALDQALAHAMEIADALDHAHRHAIVHRDLKPGNVMLARTDDPTGGERAVLLDFGLARLMPASASSASVPLTETAPTSVVGAVLGTPTYMAPEQIEGRPADARTDIFAFGAVLYEMLTGRPAFEGASTPGVMAAILRADPPPLTSLLPQTPAALDRLVQTCLAKAPDSRYATMRDVRMDLRRIAHDGSASPTIWTKASAVAAMALVAVLAVVWFVGPPRAVIDVVQRLLPGAVAPSIRSVAVLPFTNLSGNPDEEWFADGMTEALIGELSRVSRLKVIARASAMRYKRTTKTLPQIATDLNVDGILVGSAALEGDQVRIAVKLSDGRTEELLWSERYQRDFRDVLTLHGEIALTVVRRINAPLTPSEEASLARARRVERRSYEALLRGRSAFAKFTAEGMKTAIDHYERALALDGNDAAVTTNLALAYMVRLRFDHGRSSGELWERTIALAEQAVRLDVTLVQAHVTLGWFRFWSLDWAAAERAFRRAIQLDASNAEARHGHAYFLTTMGKFDEAIAEMQQARALDPFSAAIATAAHWPFYCAGRFEEAASELADARALEPQNPTVFAFLGNIRSLQGRHAEALRELQAAARHGDPGSPQYLAYLAGAHARAGRLDEALGVLAELTTRRKQRYVSSLWIARAHAAVGRGEAAIDWLEHAYAGIDSYELTVMRDPVWNDLRGHPRFRALLEKMRVPQ